MSSIENIVKKLRESHLGEDIKKSPKLKEEDLEQYKYRVAYNISSPNSTNFDDFLYLVNGIGAILVRYNSLNPKTGKMWRTKQSCIAIKDKSDYEKIKSFAKEVGGGDTVQVTQLYDLDWSKFLEVSIDDYYLGTYSVKKSKSRR